MKDLTTLFFSVRQEERAEIEAAAKADGLSLSAYLRKRMGMDPLVRDTAHTARAGRLGGKARAARLSADARSHIASLGGKASKKKGPTE